MGDIDNSITGLPTITHNITIYDHLEFKMHVDGTIFPSKKVSDLISTCCFSTVTEVLHVLAIIKTTPINSQDHIGMAATILEDLPKSSDDSSVFSSSFRCFCSTTASTTFNSA